jgi:tRNA-dihydrouridine synthase
MEAVTDVVFRHVVAAAAPPDVYFTEFTNATGWVHAGEPAIGGRLVKTDEESIMVAQLWGAVPEDMAQLTAHCRELGYKGVDINMGCPDSSAVKAGGGAGMIRTPELAHAMIAAAKTAGLPVSAKTRLGYSRVDEWEPWLRGLLEQDIAALTIHLRTKKEMSKVDSHHELIPAIVALRDEVAPNTPLVINGDIESRAHAMGLYEQYPGIDGFMIGRGIFHNPFAFEHEPTVHSRDELLGLLRQQLDLYDQYSALTNRPFDTLKRFFKIYVRDFEGASTLRDQLMHTHTTDEVRAILDTKNT